MSGGKLTKVLVFTRIAGQEAVLDTTQQLCAGKVGGAQVNMGATGASGTFGCGASGHSSLGTLVCRPGASGKWPPTP
jgi:hypothetical protein